MTDNFSDANKLGEGGFRAVYKGTLPDGLEIAVKRLSKYSGQGSKEFQNEVVLLHTLQHRNLVRLLDKEMNPKISDFGMAKLFAVDQSQGNTSKIGGTYGYMSPEYVLRGLFSVKSDVYSFGVLVLEIVSGQKINKFENSKDLLNYSRKKLLAYHGKCLNEYQDLYDIMGEDGANGERARNVGQLVDDDDNDNDNGIVGDMGSIDLASEAETIPLTKDQSQR
ncbi:hypothetical protein GIB67_011435 [Kingdonia uniflora]|uniref:Protein kinase domain-containing protein n=1 Tax=Kingdonia uniflora TaxID=39325 RepID=A0A7J7NM04_9MAGN|nr:hypothetical protein GIB67_011435 [Kingdonia uniflora]